MQDQQHNRCVYIHKNKINGKVYVGQAKGNPKFRWGKNGKNYKSSIFFWNAIQKYGWNEFEHIVLFENLTSDEANSIEIETIAKFNSTNPSFGYNIRGGGRNGSLNELSKQKIREANLGKVVPDDIRHKISLAMKGENNPFYGKHHTKEARQKMRDSKKDISGKNNPMYGKYHSEETKEKIRQKRLGAHTSIESKLKKSNPVKCIETGKNYVSGKEAWRQTGVRDANIGRCCKGIQKTAGGLHWRFLTEEEISEFIKEILTQKEG